MRLTAPIICFLLSLMCGATPAAAGIISFEHIVVVVQENRTPDNLFHALCSQPAQCSVSPNGKQYNIQTGNWLNKDSGTGVTQPGPEALANHYDLSHEHSAYTSMCDWDAGSATCRMDGAAGVPCLPSCSLKYPQYYYVDNANGILDPYLDLTRQYGWANYMFQTNQGPSYPAHQFLFGGTSAPSATLDHEGSFASENPEVGGFRTRGCASKPGARVQLVDPRGVEDPGNTTFPCFEHRTVGDLMTSHGLSWRYYAPGANTIWTAPNSISHICRANDGRCTGIIWKTDVDLVSSDVLKDIARCSLRNVVWVVPTGQNSDHPLGNTGGGPSWVASIVNAIGNSKCKDGPLPYWDDTAILITWDDWGGWYDHVAPARLAYPEGGYQYGFRVPLIVVSAYTPRGYIDNQRHDFGSMIRFIEHNFLVREGALTFADARAKTDLMEFFLLTAPPRSFRKIAAPLDANDFLNDKSPQLPPDDD